MEDSNQSQGLDRDRIRSEAQQQPAGPLVKAHARAALSSDGVVFALIGELAQRENEVATQMSNVDLTSPEGIAAGQKLQGKIQGLRMAQDFIFDFCEEGEMEQESNE